MKNILELIEIVDAVINVKYHVQWDTLDHICDFLI